MVLEWVAALAVGGMALIHWSHINRKYTELIRSLEDQIKMAEEDMAEQQDLAGWIDEGKIPEEGIQQLAMMSSQISVDRASSRRAAIVDVACCAGIVALGTTGLTPAEGAMMFLVCLIPAGILWYHLKNISTRFARGGRSKRSARLAS